MFPYRITFTTTVSASNSFIFSSLRQWNSLDKSIGNSKTLSTFKATLKVKIVENFLCELLSSKPNPTGRCLIQIRFGLSKLRFHLYTIAIIAKPFCTNCQARANKTVFHCVLAAPCLRCSQRSDIGRGLARLLPAETIKYKRLLTCLLSTLDCSLKVSSLVNTKPLGAEVSPRLRGYFSQQPTSPCLFCVLYVFGRHITLPVLPSQQLVR